MKKKKSKKKPTHYELEKDEEIMKTIVFIAYCQQE